MCVTAACLCCQDTSPHKLAKAATSCTSWLSGALEHVPGRCTTSPDLQQLPLPNPRRLATWQALSLVGLEERGRFLFSTRTLPPPSRFWLAGSGCGQHRFCGWRFTVPSAAVAPWLFAESRPTAHKSRYYDFNVDGRKQRPTRGRSDKAIDMYSPCSHGQEVLELQCHI